MFSKLHSPVPFFLLTALAGLIPVLNNKYPSSFFPAVSPGLVELLSVTFGIAAAALGFSRLWARLVQRSHARRLLREAVEELNPTGDIEPGDAAGAGRLVSRMVRNADEDLREISPDFTIDSLKRLQKFIPALLAEIRSKDDAFIRLGVVGTYLGELKCRNGEWQWYFKANPSLGRFSFLASTLRRTIIPGGEDPSGFKNGNLGAHPYGLAGDWLAGTEGLGTILKWAQS